MLRRPHARRTWGRAALLCSLAILGACGGSKKLGQSGSTPIEPEAKTTSTSTTVADVKRDIVLITTDDQNYSTLKFMPTVNQLLTAEGTEFSRHFVAFPVCCPSRATWLTGEHAHNHDVRSNAPPDGGASKFKAKSTVATWLDAAGYRTAFVGKYLNGYGEDGQAPTPPGWDTWQATLDPGTYQPYDYQVTTAGTGAIEPVRYYGSDPSDYQTDVMTELAVTQIEKAGKAPLFLNVNYRAPHVDDWERIDSTSPNGPEPAPRHRGTFASLADDPATVFGESEEQYNAKPAFVRPEAWEKLVFLDRSEIVQRTRNEAESLQAVDEGIGKIIAALRERGTLDKALIIFTSDNGSFHGEHGIYAGKYYPYEPAIHTPLIVRGPGFLHQSSAAMVSNVDIAATIASFANVETPKLTDGLPLQVAAAEQARGATRALLLEGHPESITGVFQGFYGVRTQRYSYIEWADGSVELYDLAIDPTQLTNLADVPAIGPLRDALSLLVARLKGCQGTTCVRYVDPDSLPNPNLYATTTTTTKRP